MNNKQFQVNNNESNVVIRNKDFEKTSFSFSKDLPSNKLEMLMKENSELKFVIEKLNRENKKLCKDFARFQREFELFKSNSKDIEETLLNSIEELEKEVLIIVLNKKKNYLSQQYNNVANNQATKVKEISLLKKKLEESQSMLEETSKKYINYNSK